MLIHVVGSGETLYSIAARYGVSVSVLALNNSVSDPTRLAIGQSIAVAIPLVTHTVRPGDTLFSIASAYGTDVNSLFRNNLILQGRDNLYDGQTLIIEIEKTPIGGYQLGGYAYPFITDYLLGVTLPFMNYLMPFTYGFTREGALIPPEDSGMLARAAVYGTKGVMHLSTLDESGAFSTENGSFLLSERGLWSVLLENILATLREKNYYGLDVDFEFLGAENAKPYAEFISFLTAALNPYGYGVIVALAPKTSDSQPGLLYEGHDYALLGAAANAVLLMTYEWGYTFGPPLAVSPVPNIRRVIDYALTRIPPEKIFEGISNYGYDFTLPYVAGESRATSLSTRQATELAVRTSSEILYDETALSPYFYYTAEDGKAHVVWFEDARSIEAKLKLFAVYGLKGGLYWNLNRENNQNLTVINSTVLPVPPSLL